ncbi:MAG: hypothetical protein ACREPG_10055 [Candidatus Binatia bacterium]
MAAKQKSSIFDIGAVQLFIVLALIGVLVGSRWFLDPPNMVTDGAIISVIGLGCLLRVKFAKLRRGMASLESPESGIGEGDYRTAFALVCIGAILVLVGNALIEHLAP